MLALTGLSPTRRLRQDFCLDGWKSRGFAPKVVAGNTRPDIEALMDRARGRCAVIVNADIEMRINAPELKALMGQAEPSGIFWFRRINHAPGDAIGRPEEWGIDIFVSDCWPNLGDSGGLRLGAPWWDYWLPVAAIKHGIPLYTVTDQQWFWHEDHDDRWSEWDWLQTGIETVRLHELMRPGAVSWTALDCLARELCGRVFPAHTTVMRP